LLGFSDEKLKKVPDIAFNANKVKYVVETLQSISFTSNKYDVLGDFFEKIVRSELKQTKGQFLTHHNIVDFIVKCLQVGPFAIELINGKDGRPRLPYIIDPSCGSGTFQVQCMKEITRTVLQERVEHRELKQTDDIEEFLDINFPERKRNAWAKEYIYGIEINPDLAMATKVNMVGHGDGSANIFAEDGLIDFLKYSSGNKLNIRAKNAVYQKFVNGQFDVIVSNPPFSITIDRETAKQLPSLYLQGEKIAKSLKKDAKKDVETELLYIERYYQLLNEGGRLGVVLPESVFDSTSNKAVRLFIFKYFKVKAVISLPHLAFAPYTQTKTSILFAQKKYDEEVKEWQDEWDCQVEEFNKVKKHFEKVKKKKNLTNSEICGALQDYLLNDFDANDKGLSVLELLDKYEEDVKQMDEDWWVFKKVSEIFDYEIFFAHADEIGYKRGANKVEIRPNELFDVVVGGDRSEIAINTKEPKKIIDFITKQLKWS
jgi:type I restriction enzyme M protein